MSAQPGIDPPHSAEPRRPSIAEIQLAVCAHYELRMLDMVSARRSRNIARPRQIAMFLAQELTAHSLPVIGRHFGGRDHTTVLHACRMTRMRVEEDPEVAEAVAAIVDRLRDPGFVLMAAE